MISLIPKEEGGVREVGGAGGDEGAGAGGGGVAAGSGSLGAARMGAGAGAGAIGVIGIAGDFCLRKKAASSGEAKTEDS